MGWWRSRQDQHDAPRRRNETVKSAPGGWMGRTAPGARRSTFRGGTDHWKQRSDPHKALGSSSPVKRADPATSAAANPVNPPHLAEDCPPTEDAAVPLRSTTPISGLSQDRTEHEPLRTAFSVSVAEQAPPDHRRRVAHLIANRWVVCVPAERLRRDTVSRRKEPSTRRVQDSKRRTDDASQEHR